jgi:hypothetical protein
MELPFVSCDLPYHTETTLTISCRWPPRTSSWPWSGKDNDLIERIKTRPFFQPVLAEIDTLTDPSTFVGRSPEIVEKLINTKVKAALEKYKGQLDGEAVELNV